MDVLATVAADLGIKQGQTESIASFSDRVLLSAASKWMLVACFDDFEKVSVEHVKSVASHKLRLLRQAIGMKPTLGDKAGDAEDIPEYIYEILLQNGAFFHQAYHVLPCEKELVPMGMASIVRGMQSEDRCIFSGIAPILLRKVDACQISEYFDLPTVIGKDAIEFVWRRSVPIINDTEINEFLKFENLRRGYYSPQRKDSNPFTMGRTAHTSTGYEYYIIHRNERKRIPDSLIEEGWHEYCRLAIINSVVRQSVIARSNGSILDLQFGYKLPRNDLRFLRLVAWPPSLSSLDGAFDFSIHHAIWPALKQRLIDLGYKVEES